MALEDLTVAHNSVSITSDRVKGQVNRNVIKRIKKELVFKDSKYESLKKKFLGSQAAANLNSSQLNDDSAASNNELDQEQLLGSEEQSY